MIRVLTRLRCHRGDPKAKATEKAIWEAARQLVPEARPGDFNQALMELGAMCCTPKAPGCGKCPVRDSCGVAQSAVEKQMPCEELALRYPQKAEKKASKQQTVAVCALHCTGSDSLRRWLLVQRPSTGLLAKLWEFPTVHVEPTDSAETRRAALMAYIADKLGVVDMARDGPALMAGAVSCGELKHVFSHIDQQLHVDALAIPSQELREEDAPPRRWLSDEEVGKAAVSTQMKKVFRAALAPQGTKNGTNNTKKRKAKEEATGETPQAAAATQSSMRQFLYKKPAQHNT